MNHSGQNRSSTFSCVSDLSHSFSVVLFLKQVVDLYLERTVAQKQQEIIKLSVSSSVISHEGHYGKYILQLIIVYIINYSMFPFLRKHNDEH